MKAFLTLFFAFVAIAAVHASEPFNGLLVDFNGKPIKGARVYVHNPKHYAKSDKEGKFGLTDVKSTDTLHVKTHKMTYEIPVNGSKGMRITIGELSATGAEDQELIRMGTGYVKKREYLGPRSGVTHEQLVATGQTDLIQAMRGLVAGVRVVNNDYGKDDKVKQEKDRIISGPNLSIRNSMSFNAPTNPLWVIDGTESIIPPSLTVMEVESVEILKDGAGYGTRGANGVIIVTLKK
ncbi:MAG: TonB-dependent receptor plug domain-containing protein [Bacteroidales bacterium]|nr:TonB-dependent receptor plug domain-containing protein [Bacteroidales bacterium]